MSDTLTPTHQPGIQLGNHPFSYTAIRSICISFYILFSSILICTECVSLSFVRLGVCVCVVCATRMSATSLTGIIIIITTCLPAQHSHCISEYIKLCDSIRSLLLAGRTYTHNAPYRWRKMEWPHEARRAQATGHTVYMENGIAPLDVLAIWIINDHIYFPSWTKFSV